jgi:hypothetical protein
LRFLAVFLFAASFFFHVYAYADDSPDILQAEDLLNQAQSRYSRLQGYQADFEREELKEGKWRNVEGFLKFEKPFNLFYGLQRGHHAGRQILYAEGHFNDKMQVRPPGFFFNFIPIVAIETDDPRVTKEENHSIKSLGIGPFLEEFYEAFERAKSKGELTVLTMEDAVVGEEKGKRIDVRFDGRDYDYPRTTIVFSDDHRMPIEIQLFQTSEEVQGIYRYLNMKLDSPSDDPSFKRHADHRLYRLYQQINS